MLLVLLLAIVWFATGKKRLSLLAFFALLTNGFMLVPQEAYTVVANLKPSDYGILYCLSVAAIAYARNRNYYKGEAYFPPFTRVLLLFLAVSYLVSVSLYHIPAFESLKYVRKYMLLLAPAVLCLFSREELEDTVKVLFKVTLVQCFLYLLQPILKTQILTGHSTEGVTSFFGLFSIPRYYNVPVYLWFFLFYACYRKGVDEKKRLLQVAFMFLPVLVSMHRSHVAAYIVVLILGYAVVRMRKMLPLIIGLMIIIIPFAGIISNNVERNKSVMDIAGAFEIGYEDFDPGNDGEATFTFRIMHFLERFDRTMEKPETAIFGLGYMADGSNYANANFDFFIGLEDEETGDVIQFETADIAWSEMIVRLGLAGIAVYLLYYIALMLRFLKERESEYGRSAYCGMAVLLILSFTSVMIMDMSNMVLLLAIYEILKNKNKEEVIPVQDAK